MYRWLLVGAIVCLMACSDDDKGSAGGTGAANGGTGGMSATGGMTGTGGMGSGGIDATGGTGSGGMGSGGSDGTGGQEPSVGEAFVADCFDPESLPEVTTYDLTGGTDCDATLTQDDADALCGEPGDLELNLDECLLINDTANGCEVAAWEDWAQVTVEYEDGTICVWGTAL